MDEQNRTDNEAVRQAVLDYVEGVYDVDPTKIERSVHPDLVKGGFFKKDGEAQYNFTSMSFMQFVELSRHYNLDGKMPSNAAKEITVLDIQEQIASAKLEAWWGIDYMHLAKYANRWIIVHVLWQTHPDLDNRLASIETSGS